MTCNLTGYQASEEQVRRIVDGVEEFNRKRTSLDGYYAMSLPTSHRPYCGLWRVFPDAVLVYVRTLGIGVDMALERAMQMLHYCNLKLNIESSQFFEKAYGSTADVVHFGKYRGKRMAEVYYVDPVYVGWIASKYTPDSRHGEQLVALAKLFMKIDFELAVPKRKVVARGEYVGEVGEKLENLSLVVIHVRLQVDCYKSDFHVDQSVLAVDRAGNRFTFLIKAAGPSQTPKVLHCRSRKLQLRETLVLKSAKVLRHYESNGVRYTRLGYIKYEAGPQ